MLRDVEEEEEEEEGKPKAVGYIQAHPLPPAPAVATSSLLCFVLCLCPVVLFPALVSLCMPALQLMDW